MFFRRHRKLIIFLIMLTIVLISALVGYLIADSEPRVVAQTQDDDEAVLAEADNDRIDAHTVITWNYDYEMCRHHVYLDTQPAPDMIGLNFTQLKNKYTDIIIESFSAEKVVLKKRFECYCPEHFLLKKKGEKLAVYRTAAGTDKQDIYIDVDIEFASLSKQQQEQLEDGRVFGDINDLQPFLEKLDKQK